MQNAIDAKMFSQLGGDVKRPPFISCALGSAQPTIRLFVSTLWHRDWPSWSKAAKIARDTIAMGVNPVLLERGISAGEAVELDTFPLFVIRQMRAAAQSFEIWLNATIDSQESYDGALIVAEAERRLILSGRLSKASPEGQLAIVGTRTVVDDLSDAETVSGVARRLLERNEPESKARERLISEIMELMQK